MNNLADKGAHGIHKKVCNLNTIKSEVHFQSFGISPSCMANLMMIKTFHYYEFWVSFSNMLVGQSKKSLIFHTHLNQNSRYSTEIRGGTNSSMFTNCLVLGNFREVQNSVLGQNHMFRYVQSSFETSFY